MPIGLWVKRDVLTTLSLGWGDKVKQKHYGKDVFLQLPGVWRVLRGISHG